MVRLSITLGLVITILYFLGCKDRELITKPYIDADVKLKMNGYYYHTDKPVDFTKDHGFQKDRGIDSLTSVYFLYKNGVFNYYCSHWSKEFPVFYKYCNISPNNKSQWGVLNIQGNKITMEAWYSNSGGPLQTVMT
jgi:hypothetical protein